MTPSNMLYACMRNILTKYVNVVNNLELKCRGVGKAKIAAVYMAKTNEKEPVRTKQASEASGCLSTQLFVNY